MKESHKAKPRVTMADVGRRCGYHCSTVGLALRNHPRITEATRQRILKAAEELGYRPDPALSSLIAHRRNLQTPTGVSTIGVLSDSSPARRWRDSHFTGREYFEGMVHQANALGFQLDEFSIGNDHEKQKRVDGILKARGIRSVVVAPMHSLTLPLSIDWSAYSAVAIGYSLPKPRLRCVTHQHRTGAQMAVEELLRLGYQRVALILPFSYDKRVGHGSSAGFFCSSQLYRDRMEFLSYFTMDHNNLCTEEVLGWIRSNRPEAVITSQQHFHDYLVHQGFRIPEDIGYVELGWNRNRPEISGVNQNSTEVGKEVINWIAALNEVNRLGLPLVREIRLVQGTWVPGKTVRRVGAPRIEEEPV